MSKTAQITFFSSKRYFPIVVDIAPDEQFQINTRSHIGKPEIIDINRNGSHIGMFIGIRKENNIFFFGPSSINKPFKFRNILPFTFVKLLDYHGLEDVNSIYAWAPEDVEYYDFFERLGFKLEGDYFIYELNEESIKQLAENLEKENVHIRTIEEQVKTIIQYCNKGKAKEEIEKKVKIVLSKIKDESVPDKKYWDSRKLNQLNLMVHAAAILPDKLEKEEFLEDVVKTMITSFDFDIRLAIGHEIIKALKGKKRFEVPQIQKLIDNLRKLVPKEIDELNKEHYITWINKNMPLWKKHEDTVIKTQEMIEKSKRLEISDFGDNIEQDFIETVEDFVNHFNGEVKFLGLKTRI